MDQLPWTTILRGLGNSLIMLADSLCEVRSETDVMVAGRLALQYINEVHEKSGAPGEIRTPGLLVRSQTLYPAELRAHKFYNTTAYCSSLAMLSANFCVLSQIEGF